MTVGRLEGEEKNTFPLASLKERGKKEEVLPPTSGFHIDGGKKGPILVVKKKEVVLLRIDVVQKLE